MSDAREFDRVAADGYDVFDAMSGNLVTSFDDKASLAAALPEMIASVGERREELAVFALDPRGEIVASWRATELFVDA